MVFFYDIVIIFLVKYNIWKFILEEFRIYSGNGRKIINNNFLKVFFICFMDGKFCVCEYLRLVIMKLEFEF